MECKHNLTSQLMVQS